MFQTPTLSLSVGEVPVRHNESGLAGTGGGTDRLEPKRIAADRVKLSDFPFWKGWLLWR